MSPIRSLLFLPAHQPHRFERALASGADVVCLDLEDAVPPDQKTAAREALRAVLSRDRAGRSGRSGRRVGVRLNGLDTPHWREDAAVAAACDFVMLPKTTGPADLATLAQALPADLPLWPLVESADGLRHAWDIAAAPQVEAILFGAFDYAADIGCELAWEPLLYARGRLAAACGRARVALIDAPYGDLNDAAGLEESTRRAKALGFTGRACIHPAQVASVNAIYTPSPDEVAHARRVLAAFDAAAGGAVQLDGRFIDLPVALAARRVLARAGD
jgi:citrate lyase subunit beta/citryl-CoA lyase/(S)-citramalyl-CoA lyase